MSTEMTEFKITSDLAVIRQQIITANFDEVREWLDENLEPYRRMAVTEDGISTAKAYRANIRKVRDRIDSCRKEAKQAALAAYTEFETRCKELTSLCDEAAGSLDGQIKAFEEEEKKEKIGRLLQEYCDLANEELREYCPWDRLLNEKWGNKGYKYEDAAEEIRAALFYTASDLQSIRDTGGEDTAYLLDIYKQTHDLNAVIRKHLELKAMREREAARKAEQPPVPKQEAPTVSKQEEVEAQIEEEPLITVDFRVTTSKAKLTALGQYMKANGIKYGRVT